MFTVYMPRDFDEEAWRDSPADWKTELLEHNKIAEDGTAEFLVADILGTEDFDLELTGDMPTAPEGTNFVVVTLEGDACDQGDSVAEVVANIRDCMKDYDWPLELTFIFWRHHEKAARLAVN